MHLKLSCVLGLILIICCNHFVEAGVSDDVKKLFEEFRVRMCHPFPQWNLPALDPYKVEHEEIYLDNNIFKNFSGSVTDLRVTGLSEFIINEVKLSILSQKIKLDITFPLEELKSKYTAEGSLGYVVNLVGDDKLKSHLKDLRIIVTAGIKIGFKFGIKNLNIKFSIGDFNINMGKIMEHERVNSFFHNLMNDLSIELLGDFWEDYGEPLTKKLENRINEKMSSFTLKEIIAIISGSAGKPIFGDDPPGDCIKTTEDTILQNELNP